MNALRTVFTLTTALAVVACASTPQAGMTLTPVACADPDYGCSGEVADYSESYGTAYYPVLIPAYPIALPPAAPTTPLKPPPPPPPPPKIRVRLPVEKPCPKGGTSCP